MDLSTLYQECRTIRKFKQQEIPETEIDAILENLRYVHSGNNRQTLRYIAVLSQDVKDAIAAQIHFAALLPREIGEPKKEEQAAAYLVIVAKKEHARVIDIDTGIAAEYVMESAFEKGIGACMMLNYNVNAVNEILHLPEDDSAAMVIALGYPAHTSQAVEIGPDGSTAYTCDEAYHYRVPKKTRAQISTKI